MFRVVLRALAVIAVAVGVVASLGACSSGDAKGVPAGAVVVDVRTPAEYAAGHLAGAINVDVESPDFTASISRLDKSGQYLVYCHSGNRAGLATSRMHGLGYTHVTNLGGIDAAASTTGLALEK
jgi:rhodanese-related sulfurtransferase